MGTQTHEHFAPPYPRLHRHDQILIFSSLCCRITALLSTHGRRQEPFKASHTVRGALQPILRAVGAIESEHESHCPVVAFTNCRGPVCS